VHLAGSHYTEKRPWVCDTRVTPFEQKSWELYGQLCKAADREQCWKHI